METNDNQKSDNLDDYSDDDKRMLSLRWQGKTYKEIAVELGKKEPAVKKQFSRKLNKAMNDNDFVLRVLNWEHCQKKIISLGFDIYKEAEEHSDKRQTLNTLSKLLEPFTPKDKQSNVADIHIRILTAKEAEKAKENGENVIAIDDYFNEGKDEGQ